MIENNHPIYIREKGKRTVVSRKKEEARGGSNLFRILPPPNRLAAIFASTCWLPICFVSFLCFLLSFCSCSICLVGHCLVILLPIMQRVPSQYNLSTYVMGLWPSKPCITHIHKTLYAKRSCDSLSHDFWRLSVEIGSWNLC